MQIFNNKEFNMCTLSDIAWNAALFKIAQTRLGKVDRPTSFEGLIDGISQQIESLETERTVLMQIAPHLGELRRQLDGTSHAFSRLPGCSEELFLDAVAPLAFELGGITSSEEAHIPFLLCVNPTVVGPLQQLATLLYNDADIRWVLHMGLLKPWPPGKTIHSNAYVLKNVAGFNLHLGHDENSIKTWAEKEHRHLLNLEEMVTVLRLVPCFFDKMVRKKFLVMGSDYGGNLIQLLMHQDKPAFLEFRGPSSMEDFAILTAAGRLEAPKS